MRSRLVVLLASMRSRLVVLLAGMRSRWVMVLAVALAMAGAAGASIRLTASSPSRPPPVHAPLPPRPAAYLGVFEAGAPPAYSPIASFAEAAGRQPNLLGYYSGWAGTFDTSFAELLYRHRVIPFVQLDPTDASVPAIAAGTYDDWLRTYADSVADFGHAVVIGFGHEMNAPSYSWGYGHVPASTFVKAWRHIVTLFHDEGADNVTWLWTLQADRPGTGPINSWWPGAQYVTWVGIDGYYYRPTDTFASVFGTTIVQVRALTNKPILLSETAVGPDAGQFVKIQNLFEGMATYKTLGLVWFDKAQHGGIYHQDWRIEDNPLAEDSFRLGVLRELAPSPPDG
jgi:mannan endo-1,4-beta-mannosidase